MSTIIEQAILLDTEVRQWEERASRQFARLGEIILECETKELWRYLPQGFHSFEQWVCDALPVSRNTGYAARNAARILSALPLQEREQICPGNLRTLAEADDRELLSSPEILTAAKEMKPGPFREKVKREYPDLHLEMHKPYKFNPNETQRAQIDESIQLAIDLGDAGSREEALFNFAISYWQENVYRRSQKPKAAAVSRVQ